MVTFVYLGPSLDAALWAVVQVVLVVLAAYDVESRRLPNRITLPVAAVAIALRAAFERDALREVVVAGALSFVIFWILALIMRGGLGMGDVKLAGMLGFLLGNDVLSALVLGVITGGVWGAILLGSGRAGLRSKIAYGQFLAFGGAVAILLFSPPPLV